MCIKQYDAFLKMFKALSVCVSWQSFEPVVVFLLSAYLMRLFLICVNVSEEHYFSSRSFTLASSYLKIIIEHLLCAINELAHGLCPQETASRESTRITPTSTQTCEIGNPSPLPWSRKALGCSLPHVSFIILRSWLTSLRHVSHR